MACKSTSDKTGKRIKQMLLYVYKVGFVAFYKKVHSVYEIEIYNATFSPLLLFYWHSLEHAHKSFPELFKCTNFSLNIYILHAKMLTLDKSVTEKKVFIM